MQPLYIACRLAAPCGVADYIKGDVLCSDMEKADWIAPIGFKMSLYCTEIALIRPKQTADICWQGSALHYQSKSLHWDFPGSLLSFLTLHHQHHSRQSPQN